MRFLNEEELDARLAARPPVGSSPKQPAAEENPRIGELRVKLFGCMTAVDPDPPELRRIKAALARGERPPEFDSLPDSEFGEFKAGVMEYLDLLAASKH